MHKFTNCRSRAYSNLKLIMNRNQKFIHHVIFRADELLKLMKKCSENPNWICKDCYDGGVLLEVTK